jgi:hypothetical protein
VDLVDEAERVKPIQEVVFGDPLGKVRDVENLFVMQVGRGWAR